MDNLKERLLKAIQFCEQRSFANDTYLQLYRDALDAIERMERDAERLKKELEECQRSR